LRAEYDKLKKTDTTVSDRCHEIDFGYNRWNIRARSVRFTGCSAWIRTNRFGLFITRRRSLWSLSSLR